MPNPLLIPVWRWLRRRRFPTLLKITAALFVLNVFVPDPIPFVDELLLGLATLTLGAMRRPPDELDGAEDLGDPRDPRDPRDPKRRHRAD